MSYKSLKIQEYVEYLNIEFVVGRSEWYILDNHIILLSKDMISENLGLRLGS